ncbi:MAG: cell division protein FtsL [Actinobacteria bacterium]|nr:cell division protein FtsL [Actinomycetota bacterium]
MSAVPQSRRVPGRAPTPRLRVVTAPRRRRTLLFALVLVTISGAAVFATLTVNALAAADAVRAAQLEADVAEAERRYAELVAEVAALEDPARIEQVALDELGMVPADGARFLVVERRLPQDGTVVTEAATGGQTDRMKPVLSVQR